jgi:CheY-like chemotaxis protein
VELLAYALRLDGVEVRLDLGPDLPRLPADRYQLQEVLVNLVTNARHAMQAVAVRRLAIATRHDAGRARVVLRVADSGPGVPPAVRERIFEPFFTTKPAGEGTGLGLSLCLGIVEGHGGTLTLDPPDGGGAAFRIELPTDVAVSAGASAPPAAPAAAGAGRHVLVVDDEPTVAAMLARMLAGEGYHVDTVTSGDDALARLAGRRYDVVVTDVRMPGVDGRQLYSHCGPSAGGPAFVFMTGDALTGETAAFLAEAGAPHLTKPFVLEDVRAAMAEARATAPAASRR